MKFLYSDEPIIACSTSQQSNAAMAVVRISGFENISQFSSFFRCDLSKLEPRRVLYTTLVNSHGERVDDVCLTFFESPRSYNGENILEISLHGNTLNVERVINLFVEQTGCRQAQPGEFTYRALRNRKLSLSQVEGLDLFLNANSGYALDQGLSLLSGNLHDIYHEVWELFLKHKSALELSIDFSDDVGEETAKSYFFSSLNSLEEKFATLSRRVAPMSASLLQPEIVIAGLPNAGKSSFFNFLLSDSRAIVSAQAGTTRDYLSESLMVEGVRYKIIDTAGIRDADNFIESEGIKRSHKKIKDSFFSILLINPFEMSGDFSELLNQHFDLIYFSHADKVGFSDKRAQVEFQYPQLGSIGAISLFSTSRIWEESLFRQVNDKYLLTIRSQPMLLERHKPLILHARGLLSEYSALAMTEHDVGILSHELNRVGHCISELIGVISPDQILNSIFSNFCIGK